MENIFTNLLKQVPWRGTAKESAQSSTRLELVQSSVTLEQCQGNHPVITPLSPRNHPLWCRIWRHVAMYLFVLATVLFTVGVGEAWSTISFTVGVTGTGSSDTYGGSDYNIMKLNTQFYWTNTEKGWITNNMSKAGITFEGKDLYITSMTYDDAIQTWHMQFQKYKNSGQVYSWDAMNGVAKAGDYWDKYIVSYGGDRYSMMRMQYGHVYFDATNWSETSIKLVIGHANYQRYYTMSTLSGTKLFYYHLNLNDAWTDAMGCGVVGNTTATDGANWLTNVSSKAKEYTGFNHFQLDNNGANIRYLIVNNGATGEQPTMTYSSDYTDLNSTQTLNSVLKASPAGSYSTANAKATISMSSYELTGQGTTTNQTPSLSTSENTESVSACRTATTVYTVGEVATGYQFDGFYPNATTGSRLDTDVAGTYTFYPTAATTVYARFSARTYDVTLNTNSGAINEGNVMSYVYGIGATLPTNVTRTGYAFGGWYDNSSFTGSAVTTIGTSDYGNKEYWAKWTADTYTITFHNDGADTETCEVTTSKELVYDNAAQFDAYTTNIPCVEGYTFNGYKTADECGGTQLVNNSGAFLTNVSGYIDEDSRWVYADDLDLYICWSTNNHSITYTSPSNGSYTIKVGDADAVSESTTADYAQTITLAATPANTCYAFSSWTVTGATPASSTSATTTFTMPDDDVTVAATFAQVNLALNKTVVAGYEDGNDAETAAKAVDGSESTAWVTWAGQPESDEWIYVDLGAYYQLSSIHIVWGADYSTDYILQVRQSAPANSADAADDTKWYPVAEVKDAAANSTDTTLVNVPARYVRMHSLSRSSNCIRVKEMRVYGTGSASADTHAPAISTASASYDNGDAILTLTATDTEDVTTKWFRVYNPYAATWSLEQTDGDNHVTISSLPTCTTYRFKVQAMDKSAQLSDTSYINVNVPIPSTENLALSKTVTVDAGDGGSSIVDGNTGTRWSSGNSDTDVSHYVTVDLGLLRNIDSMKIAWETACPKDYYLEGSPDGTNYYPLMHKTTVPTNAGGSFNGYDKYEFEAAVGVRYLKVRSVTNNTDYGMSIWELQAFGDCYEASDKPVTTIARLASQTPNSGNTGINATIEVGAYDYATTFANMRYKIEYAEEGEEATELDNQTATSGQLTLSDLKFSTTYNVTVTARDGVDGNLADNEIEFSFTTKDRSALLYARTDMNGWHDAGLLDSERFGYVNATVMHNTINPNKDCVTYIMYYDTEDDQVIEGGDPTTSNGNQCLNGVNGETVTFFAKDVDHFVSTADLVYVGGPAVGAASESAAKQMTLSGNTYIWEGPVTTGKKFKIVVKAQKSNDIAAAAFSDHSRARIMSDSVTFSNESGYKIAKLTFDMETWTYTWSLPDVYYFDGNGGKSTSWNTAANWYNNDVPDIDDDVVLLAPAEVDVTYAQAKSVVIDQSGSNTGSLTIPAGKALVVAGTVKKTTDGSTLSATAAEDITIGSNSTNGNGALVIGDEDGSTKATVQFYTKAGMRDGEWVNQYIGTPFSDETYIKNNYYGMQIYAFSASSGEWVTPRMADDADMTPFVGYDLLSKGYTAGSHTLNMTGTLNESAEQTITLTNDKDEAKENMLANSWVAPIVISAFDEDDFVNADQTIYIFNAGSPEDYDNPSANTGSIDNAGTSTTGAGQYTCIPIHTSVEGYHTIPSMQAFSVMTKATSSAASLKLNYEQLVYNPAVLGITMEKNHAKRRAAAEGETPEIVKLYVRGESGYKDMLWMLVREDFTEGFDGGWDGRKMFGYEEAPQLYAQSEAGELSVGAVSDIEGTVLGFKAGILDDEYTFTFEYDGDEVLYLKDLYKNKYALVRTGEIYTFNDNDIGSHNRFVLTRHNSPQIATDVEPTPDPSLKGREKAVKLIIDDQMYILYRGVMYDATGKRVEERRAE